MKFEKAKQLKTIGTAVSLALLLGMGSVNANPPLHSNSPNNDHTNEDDPLGEYGASIGVSNVCEVSGNNLLVETTITDKSSGDTKPFFDNIGILPIQKVKRSPTPLGVVVPADVKLDDLNLEMTDPDTRQYDPFTTTINLCDAGLTSDATSVNAVIKVEVFNSNKTDFNSKCTAKYDGGLKIGNLGISCPEPE